MDVLLFALNAILPIILLFILGYILKHIKFLDKLFFLQLNKFIFRIALPVLLFYNIYNIENLENINWMVIGYAVACVFFIFILGFIAVVIFVKDPKQKGVILQGAFRSNFALIGFPLAQAMGSANALAVISILFAFVIPLTNVLAVVSLSMFQRNELGKIDPKAILLNVIKNPLIIGVILGIIFVYVRSLLPVDGDLVPVFTIKHQLPFLYQVIQWIAQTASPLALLALGGQFEVSMVNKLKNQIAFGTVFRIVIAPLIGLTGAYILSLRYSAFDGVFPALIALFATPVAVSSVIMASEMDNDDQLAGQLVVWTSLGSVVTIFVIIVSLRSLGVL